MISFMIVIFIDYINTKNMTLSYKSTLFCNHNYMYVYNFRNILYYCKNQFLHKFSNTLFCFHLVILFLPFLHKSTLTNRYANMQTLYFDSRQQE